MTYYEGSVLQFGTGSLLSVADDHFVVTAGHVVRDAAKDGLTLAFAGPGSRFIAPDGDWICSNGTAEPASLMDPYDVAVHRLSSRSWKKLAGKKSYRLADIDREPPPDTALYAVFGFPAVLSTPSGSDSEILTLTPFEFVTTKHLGDGGGISNYDDRFHFLLGASAEECSQPDGAPMDFRGADGRSAEFPKCLGGASGASVWRLGDLSDLDQSLRRPQRCVAGLVTSVYPRKAVIKVTRWAAVSTLVHAAFPELRPAIAMHE